MRLTIDSNDFTNKSKEVVKGALNTELEYIILEFDNKDVIRIRLFKEDLFAASFYVKDQKYRRTPVELMNKKTVVNIVLRSLEGYRNWENEIEWHEEMVNFSDRMLAMIKPKQFDSKKVIAILMRISEFAAIILSFWAGMLTVLSLGGNFYIQLYVDGYKSAVFTIKELKFYKGSTSGFGRLQTTTFDSYWAYGEIAGNEDRFELKGFANGPIQSQADLEKEFSVGQKLQVLYNPDIPKKLGVHIQYPFKDFKKTHKRRQMQMIKYAYSPWGIAFCLCFLLGVLTKNKVRLIVVSLTSLGFIGIPWFIILFRSTTMSDNFFNMLNRLFPIIEGV